MNAVRRKMASFLTEAVTQEIGAMSPESPYVKELHEIGDIDTIIAEEVDTICNIATLGEITKAFLLVRKLKTASVQKKELTKNDLDQIAEKLVSRVEAESGPLRLSKICRHIFSGI